MRRIARLAPGKSISRLRDPSLKDKRVRGENVSPFAKVILTLNIWRSPPSTTNRTLRNRPAPAARMAS